MNNNKRINNIIEALGKHEDMDSVRVLEEIGTNSSIDEVREMTAQALIRKNCPESLKVVIATEGKGINDLSARVAMSAINELLSLDDKSQALKVLDETMENAEKQEIKDTARSVKTLITYSVQ